LVDILAKKSSKASPRKNADSKSEILFKLAIEHLELRTDNEYIPYFLLDPADKKNNVFANVFIAKHCRNAYAGLFIKFTNKDKYLLTPKEKEWTTLFRQKGYACVVINKINQFDRCIEAYKHTIGVSGYNYFFSTYERAHL
jgi:hypothetical protein